VAGLDQPVAAAMAWRSLRVFARSVVARHLDLTVEGIEHLPADGPVVLAARHFHHLYDGCAIGVTVPRQLRIVVAADWVERPVGRRGLEAACRLAGWPVVLRPDTLDHRPERFADPGRRAAFEADAVRHLRLAAARTVQTLRDGHVLLVFPEGYPNVDPGYTPKQGDDELLPFQPGFARLVGLAQTAGVPPVPILPVGLAYARGPRWRLTLRFGAPRFLEGRADRVGLVREVEAEVRVLSGLPPGPTREPTG